VKTERARIALAIATGLTLALAWQSIAQMVPPAARAAEGPVPSGAEKNTRYVAPDGDDATDCASVAGRCRTIQRAVDVAHTGDVVLVATGTYSGTQNVPSLNTETFTATQVVVITKTVTLRGGYTTVNWTMPDPDANPTTVDARGGGRVLYITGDVSPTVEGLHLTGGDATRLGGDPWGKDGGGGVYVLDATAVISNCAVYGNTASTARSASGGGMFLKNASATVRGSRIFSNTASTGDNGSGGGLNLRAGGGLVVDNTVIGNTASTAGRGEGGGICLRHSHATLSGNSVAGNLGSTASTGRGGGLYLDHSTAELTANTVWGNTASLKFVGYGGGVYMTREAPSLRNNAVQSNTATVGMGQIGYGGGVFMDSVDGAVLRGNTVRANTASIAGGGWGGGVSAMNSSAVTLRENRIEHNLGSTAHAGHGGGLSAVATAGLRLIGNLVQGNLASASGFGNGGGVYMSSCEQGTLSANTIVGNVDTLEPTDVGKGGGAFLHSGGPFTVTNNLVACNHAKSEGGGLYFSGWSGGPLFGRLLHNTVADNACNLASDGVKLDNYVTLAFTNTIISGHEDKGLWVNSLSTATLEATLWYSNGDNAYGAGYIDTGTVNVYGDPAFIDPVSFEYHVGSASAAIDAGIDAGLAEDIDGDPRPVGVAPDTGADEFRLRYAYLPLITRN
jgi:hypothetical protein